MLFTISKDFDFAAGHQLGDLPEGHQCARPHGHNYIVRVVLQSSGLRPPGFVMDYGDLSSLKAYLDETFDHRWLNDVVEFEPTAENLAAHLLGWCSTMGWPVKRVGVSETPKTWAWAQ